MTSVSGITSRMISFERFRFFERAPTPAAPIRAGPRPVAKSGNPIARPAPSAIQPHSITVLLSGCRPSSRSFETVGRRRTAADEEILEELT